MRIFELSTYKILNKHVSVTYQGDDGRQKDTVKRILNTIL